MARREAESKAGGVIWCQTLQRGTEMTAKHLLGRERFCPAEVGECWTHRVKWVGSDAHFYYRLLPLNRDEKNN